MKKVVALAAMGSVVAVLGTQALAADDPGMLIVPSESSIKWISDPAHLPKGTKLSVVMGDPAKPGPFVLRVSLPPNTVIAPHTHATPETLTILSGTLYHDMGDKLDKSRGKPVEAGGFVYLPAEMSHSVWTQDQPMTLQVNGTGPFGLKYINPADDPG